MQNDAHATRCIITTSSLLRATICGLHRTPGGFIIDTMFDLSLFPDLLGFEKVFEVYVTGFELRLRKQQDRW